MAEEKAPEIPTKIPAARSDKFSSVTKVGNEAVTVLAKAADKGPEAIVAAIQSSLPLVLQTVVEVTLERAKLWSQIDVVEELRYFSDLDYDSWVNPGDLNSSELKQATVSFRVAKLGPNYLIRSIFS